MQEDSLFIYFFPQVSDFFLFFFVLKLFLPIVITHSEYILYCTFVLGNIHKRCHFSGFIPLHN